MFIDTRYNFAGPSTSQRAGDYLQSAPAVGGNGSKAGAEDAGEGAAGKSEGGDGREEKRTNVGIERVHEWRDQVNDALQLDKSVDDGRRSNGVKKQRMSSRLRGCKPVLTKGKAEKDGRARKKDREKHHERKESRYKERGK